MFLLLVCCSQRWRETNEEKRAMERSNFEVINEVRQAAEVHRQVWRFRHASRFAGLFRFSRSYRSASCLVLPYH